MIRRLFQTSTLLCASAAAAIDFEVLFRPYLSNGAQVASIGGGNFPDVVSHRWSTWVEPQYQGAIKPATVEDVIEIVKIADKNNISFLATVNGHGTNLHYGEHPIDLNINLSLLDSIDVDAANYRMTIGAGVTLGDVFPKIYEAGRELPTGNAICVGVVGLTVGGGVGTQLGKHGLTLDALLSVRLVTWTGDIVTASKTENPDLFWAVRGAGANFGIIVSATYELYDATNNGQVLYNTYQFPPSANRSIFELMATYDGDGLPPEMSFIPEVMYNRTTGEAKLLLLLVYYGTPEEAQPHIDRILALEPLATTSYYGPQPGMFDILSVGLCDTAGRNHFHLGTRRTDPVVYEEVFGDMVEFYEANPGYAGVLIFQRLSSGFAESIPSSETAYPWRGIGTFVLMLNKFDETVSEDVIEKMGDKIRNKIQPVSGFKTTQVYLNYDYGDEPLSEIYGEWNLDKLSRLKTQWDPRNKFGRGNPIPLEQGHRSGPPAVLTELR